jgi:hypothetical protein
LKSSGEQGEQIGQFFAYWAIVYFGRFIATDRSGPSSCFTFPHGNGSVLILTKHGLGYILGKFITNSSVSILTKHRLGHIVGEFITNSSYHPDGEPKAFAPPFEVTRNEINDRIIGSCFPSSKNN